MKKGGFLRNVLDTIRSNQAGQQGAGGGSSGGSGGSSSAGRSEYGGFLKPQHFSLTQVARHGFPEHPTALAFDPVQKIAAIGTKTGAMRVFGRPGVDVWVQHTPQVPVTHIKFIINQGAIITVTADESINLWSLRGPELQLTFSAAPLSGAHSPTPAAAVPSPTSGQAGASAAAAELAQNSAADYLSCGMDQLDASLPQSASAAAGAGSGAPGAAGEIQSRVPTILHTLKFQREHITCLHQTLMSKWLYIGTERGNVHVANVETFELSGYSIPWNKAIELSRKTHPGPIISISECPQDTNKLLIGYESGCIVLWDLKNRNAEGRYYHTEGLIWLAWHYEGKQFMAAHADGSLVTWQTRSNARPAQILHPHAKTSQQQRAAAAAAAATSSASSGTEQQTGIEQFVSSGHQQVPLAAQATSFARALNNELYRPINKVEWKTSKASNEQFLLFSGGLPYDSVDIEAGDSLRQSLGVSPLQATAGTRVPSSSSSSLATQHTNQYLTTAPGAPATSPGFSSPMSPSLSPSNSSHDSSRPTGNSLQAARSPTHQSTTAGSWSASATPAHLRDRRNLRATSLTVMFGKSITVLEMDDAIVDFVSVCDNSPYENDASDPYAVLVLLSNDLILIDLTSSGYPSFESPYPASALNESPVTSIQYLADCSSDIIPMLYSSSRTVLSRAPKKGFSDKEWPINGGEWGQQMQSYPELVITGHADGTIKFWDMSGVNFDLISKIKTAKLFERPQKPANHIIVANNTYRQHLQQSLNKRRSHATNNRSSSPLAPAQQQHPTTTLEGDGSENDSTTPLNDVGQLPTIGLEDCFAIEKIEYCSESRHLLVAGALSQVIQFKLNKRDSGSSPSGAGPATGGAHHELTSLLVEPCPSPNSGSFNEQANQSQHHRTNLLLKARGPHQASSTSSASGGSSSSASGALSTPGSHQRPNRTSGAPPQPWTAFQPTMICLTPLILMSSGAGSEFEKTPALSEAGQLPTDVYIAPPKVTALALKASHSILAYSHENGLVLIDNIQKCVVMNASLAELYGCSDGPLSNRCDISIQPFATSSILQQHYQSTTGTTSPLSSSTYTLSGTGNNPLALDEASRRSLSSHSSNNDAPDNGGMATQHHHHHHHHQQHPKSVISGATDAESHDNGPSGDGSIRAGSLHKSSPKSNGESSGTVGQSAATSRLASGAFQRQLSTTALLSGGAGPRAGPGLFQRQMTASQLLGVAGQQPQPLSSKPAHPAPHPRSAGRLAGQLQQQQLTGSALCLSGGGGGGGAPGAQQVRGSPRRAMDANPVLAQQESDELAARARKPAAAPSKNKRIISRMLSISAIHTHSSSASSSTSSTAGATGAGPPPGQPGAGLAAAPGEAAAGLLPGDVAEPGATQDQPADKIDSSFTRSRSSSASSTALAAPSSACSHQPSPEQGERLQCLCFLDWAPPTAATAAATGSSHKSPTGPIDNRRQLLALWLGTSSGALLLVGLQMPDTDDNRVLQLQSVLAEPIPQAAVKLRGACLLLAAFSAQAHRLTPSGGSQSSSLEGDGPSLDQQQPKTQTFLVAVSEKEVRVHQLPSPAPQPSAPSPKPGQSRAAAAAAADSQVAGAQWLDWPLVQLLKGQPVARALHSDSSFAAQSGLVWWRQAEGDACLASYLATGELRVLGLPHLRLLLEADLVPYSQPRLAQSMRFSRNGHALYQAAPGQLTKFTMNAQYGALVNEMTGSLWVAREMPEQPRANFFKSLFSAAAGPARAAGGRDELFGAQAAGKALRGVATHISGLDKLKGSVASGGFQAELRQAREGLDERGDKLSDLEDRTAQMASQAEGYSQAAHQLAQRFKDKKWYQF